MLFIERITAAFAAFKDPWLVGEAQGMRKILGDLWLRSDVALIEAERHGRLFLPIIRSIPHSMQSELRQYAGRDYPLIERKKRVYFKGFWSRVWDR